MTEVDQVAAARAMLEMTISDNEELRSYFRETLEKLAVIEMLPPGIKRVQFRQLQQSGGLQFRGADIRHFTEKAGKQALTPPKFVQRTNRRLRNTNVLIDAFLGHQPFEGGEELRAKIEALTNEVLDANDPKAVLDFRNRVEELRQSELFSNYSNVKVDFVKNNDDMRAEAEIIATKETLADGEMMAEERGEELKDIEAKMASGELSPEEVQEKIEAIDAESSVETTTDQAPQGPAKSDAPEATEEVS